MARFLRGGLALRSILLGLAGVSVLPEQATAQVAEESAIETTGDTAVHLATLEWPPYTGYDLPHGGMATAVLRIALNQAGYELVVSILPWNRAVVSAREGRNNLIGFYPEYKSDNHTYQFACSDPIGEGPLGLVQRRNDIFSWRTLGDLRQVKIGTVSGYMNTSEFDAMVRRGEIVVDPVIDDLTNLRKVASGRIRLAIIDPNVMEYLIATHPRLSPKQLRFNKRVLENKTLHVCFRRTRQGIAVLHALNESLARIDVAGIQRHVLARARADIRWR